MNFFLANWKWVALAAFVLIVSIIIGTQRSQINHLHKQLSAAIVERDQALAAYELLSEQVVRQNQRINELSARAKAAEKRAAALRKQNKAQTERTAIIIESAMSRPAAATCDEAAELAKKDLAK